jgi:hypothetical protein
LTEDLRLGVLQSPLDITDKRDGNFGFFSQISLGKLPVEAEMLDIPA